MQGHLRGSLCHRPGEGLGQKNFGRGTFQGLPLGPSGTLGPKASGVSSLGHSQAGESHVLPLGVGGGAGAGWGAWGLLGSVHTALPRSPS